ncbi:MAG: tetratricopeptide repeat protein, partial [Thermosynechococcaceae cyanobacterium]
EKFWPAINNIGLVNYEAGNVDEAIVRWQAASEIDKETGEPILALAVASFKQGKKDEALKLAQKALEMDRRYGDLDFLVENLWGKRLVEDTKMVFKIPKIQETIAKIEAETAEDGGEEAQAPEELEQP